MKKNCCIVCKLVCLLVVIGAINWGLVGAFQFDLVANFFGPMSTVSRAIYVAVGIAGLLKLIGCFKPCKCCCKDGNMDRSSSCCS